MTAPAEIASIPIPSAPPAAHTIGQHAYCTGCGYDLFGLSRFGNCPECGTPRLFARRLGIQEIPAEQLDRLLRGCAWALVTIGLAVIAPLPLVRSGVDDPWSWVLAAILGLPAVAGRFASNLLLVQPDRWMFAAEWSIVIGCGALAVEAWTGAAPLAQPGAAGIVGITILLLMFAAILRAILFYPALAQLALRAGQPTLADDLLRMRWVKLTSTAFTLGMAGLGYFAAANRDRKAASVLILLAVAGWAMCGLAWVIEAVDVWRLRRAIHRLLPR